MYTQEQLQNELKTQVELADRKIREAKDLTEQHSWFFGIADTIDFAHNCGIIDDETHQNYTDKIEKAHDAYYDRINNDLQNVYKRMF